MNTVTKRAPDGAISIRADAYDSPEEVARKLGCPDRMRGIATPLRITLEGSDGWRATVFVHARRSGARGEGLRLELAQDQTDYGKDDGPTTARAGFRLAWWREDAAFKHHNAPSHD